MKREVELLEAGIMAPESAAGGSRPYSAPRQGLGAREEVRVKEEGGKWEEAGEKSGKVEDEGEEQWEQELPAYHR
jgi:hypothetical protein